MPRSKPTESSADDSLPSGALAGAAGISETEAGILRFFEPGTSPEVVAARARESGLVVDAAQVAALLARIAQRDIVPGAAGERVPVMRHDLVIARHSGGGGVQEVKDPVSGRVFTLYDFEVSIAHMLNGTRTASEVIEAAGKIGIPVTADSLRKFIRQLDAYGFLRAAIAGEAAALLPPTRGRRIWPPEVREMFQSALRLSRCGRAPEALDYLLALLQIDPENQEALHLKRQVDQLIDGAVEVEVEVDFEQVHGSKERAQGAVAVLPLSKREEPRVPAPAIAPSRPRKSLLLGGGAAVLLAGALAFPVPHHVTIRAELTAVEVAVPLAPRAGILASVDVPDGAAVTKGQVIAHLRTDELEQARATHANNAAALREQLDALARSTAPKMATFARLTAEKKQRELDAMTSRRDAALAAITGEKAANVKKRNAVALLFGKHVALKSKERDDAQKLLARVTHADARAQLTAQLADIEKGDARIKDSIASSQIAAPDDGVFAAPPSHEVGGKVADQQPYGRVNRKDALFVTFAPSAVSAEARNGPATLALAGGTRLSIVMQDDTGPKAQPGRVVVSVALPRGQSLQGAAIEIPAGNVPAIRRLLGR